VLRKGAFCLRFDIWGGFNTQSLKTTTGQQGTIIFWYFGKPAKMILKQFSEFAKLTYI